MQEAQENKFYSDLPQVLVLNQITLCFYESIHTTDLCGDSLLQSFKLFNSD